MFRHRFGLITDLILKKKVPFLATFFVVFILSYGLLFWLDFLPEPKVVGLESEESTKTEEKIVSEETEEISPKPDKMDSGEPIFPKAITISSLNRTIKVLNPTSHLVSDLDTELLHGVVRHPDSATLNQKGTVFILGHSSYLPSVKNPNFQAFNGIQNLKWGDIIVVHATEGDFTYRVERVFKAKASEHDVTIAGETKHLVIATCNSFGSSDDRYVVEANLIKESLF
jgi:LPXTG-site transpeptidase (sortase) family protein